jgi:hypothetical protein
MASTKIVQARIDDKTARLLARLRRRTGLSDSDLVRRGLELVGDLARPGGGHRIRGIGKFASGVRDLGSSKRHLAGFGRS